MADRVTATKSKIVAIADKIREKLSSQDTYTLDDMPNAIDGIGGGGTITPLSVTENGIFTASEGDGYSPVTVQINDLIAQIKVVNGAIVDTKRNLTNLSNNEARVVDGYIGIGYDGSYNPTRNGFLETGVNQMRYVPYCLEVDIEDWEISGLSSSASGTDYNSNYISVFTFGRNKSTLWGLFFDVRSELETGGRLEDTVLKFRSQNNIMTTISFGSEHEPEDCIGKTLKLYLNCDIDENDNIVYSPNRFVVALDNDIWGNGDFANYSGTGWDQYCNLGWSQYSWGCCGFKISEYRARILSNLMEV